MSRTLVMVGLLAVVAMVASSAEAVMSQGGGQMYVGQTYKDGDCTTNVELRSIEFDPSWNIIGDRVQGTFRDACNNVAPKTTYGWDAAVSCMSPEVEVAKGQQYGTIIMGAYYNNSPAAYYGGDETMDVLKIQPASSGTMAITVIGDGRPRAGGGWGDYQASAYRCTERAYMAAPDPVGQFTGGVGKYLINSSMGYWPTTYIVTDTNNDGDVTDDDADYLLNKGNANQWSTKNDFEILGNKFMTNTHWDQSFRNGGPVGGGGVISYMSRKVDGTLDQVRKAFVVDSVRDAALYPTSVAGLDLQAIRGFAAAKVQGHDTVWAYATLDSVGGIYRFMDANDDNVISKAESLLAYDSAEVTLHYEDNPDGSWGDLELIKNAEGKMFLLAVNVAVSWDVNRSLILLELDDNGDFTGGNDKARFYGEYQPGTGKSVRNFNLGEQYYRTTGWSAGNSFRNLSIEFDPNQPSAAIPEPATLLLIGTGALGAVGCIRRRRMK